MCEPTPAFLPSSSSRARHCHQPRVSAHIMKKRKEASLIAFTSQNFGEYLKGEGPSQAALCLPTLLTGLGTVSATTSSWHCYWLARDLANPPASSLPCWLWMAPRTSSHSSTPTARVPVYLCSLRKVQTSTPAWQCSALPPSTEQTQPGPG